MKNLIVYFYYTNDVNQVTHSVSYLPTVTPQEIMNDLMHSFGDVTIIGYEQGE